MEATMKVQVATRTNFEAMVLSSQKPVIVDFWAPWCVYCKKLAPIYQSLADQMSEDITFVTVNVDSERELQQRYAISSLPTLKFFCSGREIGEFIGAAPKEQLEATFKAMLRSHKECLGASSPTKP